MLKVRKIQRTVVSEEPVNVKKPVKDGTLPSDEYKDEIPPKEYELNEHSKLVFSVRRGGDLGLPFVDIRQYVITDRYTGFTKKAVTLPLEDLVDFIEILTEIDEECENIGL